MRPTDSRNLRIPVAPSSSPFLSAGRGELVFFSILEVLGGRYVVGILRRIFTIYILVR